MEETKQWDGWSAGSDRQGGGRKKEEGAEHKTTAKRRFSSPLLFFSFSLSISLFLFLSSSSGERNCGKIQTRNWESEEMKEEPSGEFPANRLGIRNADYGMLDAGEAGGGRRDGAGDPIGRAELIRLK